MFRSYILIAWRNLVRNRIYSIINITGLSIAIASCLLIGLFVTHETSFDRTVPDQAAIYRLNEYVHYDGTAPQLSAATGPPIAPFLKENHPEIKAYTRVMPATPFIYRSIALEYDGKSIRTDQLACADTSFAALFGIPILEGDWSEFVRDKNSIVLTQGLAGKIFGKTPAINKMLLMHTGDTSIYIKVTNVIADFPSTSHLRMEGLLPLPEGFPYNLNYGVMLGPTYLKLEPGVNPADFQEKFTRTIHAKNKFIDLRLQSLSTVHTGSTDVNYDYYNYNKIDGKYLKIFIVIGLAIFIIACINFINLSIAIAGYRGKEVAIKKIIGARRSHIVVQVLSETFLSVSIALLFSVVLAAFFLPFLNTILNRELTVTTLYSTRVAGIYLLVLLGTTLLAGSYPARLISSSRISEAIRSRLLLGQSRTAFRNIMVTGQFVIAAIFIVSLLVFLKQLRFLQNKDLGYSYDQVIKVQLGAESAEKMQVLSSELLKIKGVKDVTHGFLELGGHGSLFGIDYIAPGGAGKHISVNFENAAKNYLPFFGMKIVAGHNFDKDNSANEYLINETLARQIGYSDPLGKPIKLSGGWPDGRVVGVVKDYNYSSLRGGIEPLIISSINDVPAWESQLYIKLSVAEISGSLKDVERTVKSVTGNTDAGLQFLDEHFKEVYHSERQAGTMIGIIGGLAVIIACFGLLSLAAFMIVRRTKEIGVRKIVGASVKNIAFLLSKDFLKLALIAIVIAFPLAGWAMNTWLQNFAYRIRIGPSVFFIAGGVIIFITLLTVSFQAINAAFANPVKSLRTE